ncbi:MAG TPA: polysaccharide pyruvyl transferase family protein [Ramlibacter sp.]|nr:polysaccharide pyruvyl transferase family protein [Ramlibacter sp.]
MTRTFSVLSPYPIPETLRGSKVVNLGDGFILRAIERELGRAFDVERVVSPRVAPSAGQKEAMLGSRVLVGGANQLNDRYTVWPGLTAAELRATPWTFVPMGVGIHGDPGFNDGMSPQTREILDVMHERVPFSSWRCPRTVDYLARALPHRRDQFLMTGCAVTYGPALLEGERFHGAEESLAVTATERHDFWDRETALIDEAVRRFPKARKYFVVHQNFSPPAPFERLRHALLRARPHALEDKVAGLRAYARSRGFEVVVPADADACLKFYRDVDVHVGTRLHAHLLFLSMNKRSWLVPVDGRSVGMAEALGFPLPTVEELRRAWDTDFERVRARARESHKTMRQFTESLIA